MRKLFSPRITEANHKFWQKLLLVIFSVQKLNHVPPQNQTNPSKQPLKVILGVFCLIFLPLFCSLLFFLMDICMEKILQIINMKLKMQIFCRFFDIEEKISLYFEIAAILK